MKGVALDFATIRPQDVDTTGLKRSVADWNLHDFTPAEETAQRIKDATVVLTNKVVIEEDHMRSAPGLRLICVIATGTNVVNIPAAKKQGIVVCNVPSYSTTSVVQHTMALMLSLASNLSRYCTAGREEWSKLSDGFSIIEHPIVQLKGRVLGIVGLGTLGKEVAGLATSFGMKIMVSQRPGSNIQPSPDRVPLHTMLPQVDFLSIHCPLTEDTHDLIGEPELRLMKHSAFLLNVARGGIVNEQALADALLHDRLAGAAVDVMSMEPPMKNNPLLDTRLADKLLVTPHCAWSSVEARQLLVDVTVQNIESFFKGAPQNVC